MATVITMKSSMLERFGACVATGIAVALFVSACGAAPGPSGSASTTPAGPFNGKTINFLVAGSTGGAEDQEARLVANYLGPNLGATINVKDIPLGSHVVGLNDMASAKPDGLTLGLASIAGIVESNVGQLPDVHFDLTSYTYLANLFTSASGVLVTQPDNSFKSVEDLEKITDSGQVRLLIALSGTTSLQSVTALAALRIPYTEITGFASLDAVTTGFLAGDGNLTNLPASRGLPLIQTGKAQPLLVITGDKTDPTFPGTTTLPTALANLGDKADSSAAQAAQAEIPMLSLSPIVTPKGLPPDLAAVLTSALVKVGGNPDFQAAAKKAHLDAATPPLTGADLTQQIDLVNKSIDVMTPYILAASGKGS